MAHLKLLLFTRALKEHNFLPIPLEIYINIFSIKNRTRKAIKLDLIKAFKKNIMNLSFQFRVIKSTG